MLADLSFVYFQAATPGLKTYIASKFKIESHLNLLHINRITILYCLIYVK